jgi:hypothetical protein
VLPFLNRLAHHSNSKTSLTLALDLETLSSKFSLSQC